METLNRRRRRTQRGHAADVIKDTDTAGFKTERCIDASMRCRSSSTLGRPGAAACKQLGHGDREAVQADAAARSAGQDQRRREQAAGRRRCASSRSRRLCLPTRVGRWSGFMGALPESQVKEFVGKIAGLGRRLADRRRALETGGRPAGRRRLPDRREPRSYGFRCWQAESGERQGGPPGWRRALIGLGDAEAARHGDRAGARRRARIDAAVRSVRASWTGGGTAEAATQVPEADGKGWPRIPTNHQTPKTSRCALRVPASARPRSTNCWRADPPRTGVERAGGPQAAAFESCSRRSGPDRNPLPCQGAGRLSALTVQLRSPAGMTPGPPRPDLRGTRPDASGVSAGGGSVAPRGASAA